MTRILGIDLGERRVGIALSDGDGVARATARHAAARPRHRC